MMEVPLQDWGPCASMPIQTWQVMHRSSSAVRGFIGIFRLFGGSLGAALSLSIALLEMLSGGIRPYDAPSHVPYRQPPPLKPRRSSGAHGASSQVKVYTKAWDQDARRRSGIKMGARFVRVPHGIKNSNRTGDADDDVVEDAIC